MNTRKEKAGAVRLMAAVAVLAIAMSVFAGVAVYDEADAAGITYIKGDMNASQTAEKDTIWVVDGNLNIKNGVQFTVAAGATLTINKDVKVTVEGADANGNNAAFIVKDGARVIINGQLVIGEKGIADIGSKKTEATTQANEESSFIAGTFVYGTVAAQKGAKLTINAEIMKDGVVDVSSSGKKVSSIGGTLNVMPGATVDITGNIDEKLCVIATGEDKSKAVDTTKNKYLNADMDITQTEAKDNASEVSSVKFTASAENSNVYEDKKKITVVAASLFVEGKIANATLDVATVASGEYKDKDDKDVEVSASNIIANELQIAKTGAMKIEADLDVSGKLIVLFDKTPNMTITSGTITVSGTVDLVNGSIVSVSDKKAALKIDGGTFTVDNSSKSTDTVKYVDITTAENIFAEFVGAYYVYESTATKFVACELAAAIVAADGKYVDEVTVSGAGAEKKDGYAVAASFEVPADVTLNVKNALVVGKDVVVTVNAEADLDLENGIVFVDGKLVDKTGNDDLGKKIIADVIIADAENSVNTYTSLKIALTEITSGKIQLKNDATVSEDLTVPEGVTVVLGEKSMTVSAGATLTVAGTVDASSTGKLATGEKTTSKAAGKVAVENRVILASEGTFNEGTFNVAGIYVNAPLDDGNYFVMSVPTYVENLADVVSASVQGTVFYKGDLALSGTADEPKTLDVKGTFSVEGKVVLAFFTIDVESTGIITAAVSDTVGAIELTSVKGTLVISDKVDDEGKAYLAISGTPAENKVESKNVAKIAISSGVLTINDAFDASNLASFGVAADTTLAVVAKATVSALKVEGTLDVQKTAELTVSEDLTVLGAVAIADDGKIIAKGDVFVGVEKSDITGAAASVTGKNLDVTTNSKLIYVAAGSSVSDDIVKELKSTEFVVSGSTWVTVYGDENAAIADLKPTVKDAKFVEWQNEKGEKVVPKVGSPAKAIACIDENIYSVKVIGDNGIGTVAIDGKVLQKSSNVFFVDDLKAGAHTITCELKYGFEGTVVIKVNGTAISGNSFTLSGTGAEDTSVSIDISGTKAIEYDPTPVAPAEKDDGMGLTDYLLIVLVVLVVILAIIAIMRFMRS